MQKKGRREGQVSLNLAATVEKVFCYGAVVPNEGEYKLRLQNVSFFRFAFHRSISKELTARVRSLTHNNPTE